MAKRRWNMPARPGRIWWSCDVLMPKLDGFEVCRRLRAADADLPILILSARDAVTDRITGLEDGADDYVVKPFAFEELLARVRVQLRRKAPVVARELRFADFRLDTSLREGGADRGGSPSRRPNTSCSASFSSIRTRCSIAL